MRNHRLAILALAAVGLVAAAPALPTTSDVATPAAPVASAGPAGVGTATASSVLASVTAAGSTVEVGTTDLVATTDPTVRLAGSWASSAVRMLRLGATEMGSYEAASDGTDLLTALSLAEATAIGPVAVDADQLSAEADVDSAAAALQQLDIGLDLLEGLGLDLAVSTIAAEVDRTAADAAHSVAVGDVDVTLGAILGGVLGELPLDDLVTLLAQLDGIGSVEAPAHATAPDDLVTAAELAAAAALGVGDAADAVAAAAAALLAADALDPVAAYGDADALAAHVATLALLDPVGDPAGAVVAVGALLLDGDIAALACGITPPTVLDVAAAVSDLTDCIADQLAARSAAIAALAPEVTAVSAAVDDYTAAVTDATTAAAAVATAGTTLDTLVTTVDASLADLDEAPLLQLEAFVIDQQVRAVAANASASFADTSCTGTRLTVGALPPADVVDCDASTASVLAAVEALPTILTSSLDTIGTVDVAAPARLALFSTLEEQVEVAGDARVTATSVAEILHLAVPDVTIDACSLAATACALGVDVTLPLTTAQSDVPADLGAAHTSVTTSLGLVDVLLDASGSSLDVSGSAAASTAAATALDATVAVVGALDLGTLGTAGGTLVRGVDLVVDPTISATHVPVAAAPDPDPDPDPEPDPEPDPDPDPGPDPDPDPDPDPSPDPPTDGPLPDGAVDPGVDGDAEELPRTGGGAAMLALGAIGTAVMLRRRRD